MSDTEGRYYKVEEDLRFPTLTEQEELDLGRKMVSGNEEARDTFITRHLLYTLKLGQRFAGGRLPVDETTSAANEALMVAIGRFNPELGYRFRSFLIPYVRAAIARCWRARSPVDFKHGEPPIEIPIDKWLPGAPFDGEHRAGARVPDQLVQHSTVEQNDHDGFLKGELAACEETLPPRDREILRLHYVDGFNLAEIGKILKPKLSRERVRQIHAVILATLKTSLERRGIKKTQ